MTERNRKFTKKYVMTLDRKARIRGILLAICVYVHVEIAKVEHIQSNFAWGVDFDRIPGFLGGAVEGGPLSPICLPVTQFTIILIAPTPRIAW